MSQSHENLFLLLAAANTATVFFPLKHGNQIGTFSGEVQTPFARGTVSMKGRRPGTLTHDV